MSDVSEQTRRKPATKRATKDASAAAGVAAATPCGACKFLRRKCLSGCIFAPHFGSDQGSARFAAVHKVFGASNVSKLLLHIPFGQRHEAVVTISYEAQARLADPVCGCVSTILALQQQVACLQSELAMVQSQLMNSRFAFANALQSSQAPPAPPPPPMQLVMGYANNSSASTSLVNKISSFDSNFDVAAVAETVPSQSFEPLQIMSRLSQDEEEEEEDSRRASHGFQCTDALHRA